MTHRPLTVVLADHLSIINKAGMRRCSCDPLGEWMSPMQYTTHVANVLQQEFAILPQRTLVLDLPTRVADLADAIEHGEHSKDAVHLSEEEPVELAYNEGLLAAARLFRALVMVDTVDSAGEEHTDVLRTSTGRVITEEQIEDWAKNEERRRGDE